MFVKLFRRVIANAHCTSCSRPTRKSQRRMTRYEWCGKVIECPHCSKCWKSGTIITYEFV